MEDTQKTYLFYGGIGLAIILLIAYFVKRQKAAQQGAIYAEEVAQNIQTGNVSGTISGATGSSTGNSSNNINGYTDTMAYNDAKQINDKFGWCWGWACVADTDEQAIANIIRGKTKDQLAQIQYEYQKLTGKTLDQAINLYCYDSEKKVIYAAIQSVR